MIPDFLTRKHCVYRVFDAEDDCLYVGATVNLPMRMRAHMAASAWYGQAERVVITLHPDKAAAHAVERAQIRLLRPRFNITGRGPRVSWTTQDYIDAYRAWAQAPPSPYTQTRKRPVDVIREEFLRRWPELADALAEASA